MATFPGTSPNSSRCYERAMLRNVFKGLGLGGALLGAGAAGLWWALFRRPQPVTDGELHVSGIDGELEIARDRWGMSRVRGDSVKDVWFGLGFVHAQDRFWQMEMMRRLGQGRLSEILPPAIVHTEARPQA